MAKLPDGHLVLPEIEGARDSHAMHRRLVAQVEETLALEIRKCHGERFGRLVAPHQELARGHAHEFHSEAVLDDLESRMVLGVHRGAVPEAHSRRKQQDRQSDGNAFGQVACRK